MSDTILKITDLRVNYGGIEAVKGISFDVEEGSIVTLIGANGAGKSSTLRSIIGLVKPAGGQIIFRVPQDDPVGDGDGPAGIVQPQHMEDHGHDVGVAAGEVVSGVETHPFAGETAQISANVGLAFDHRDLPAGNGKQQRQRNAARAGPDDDCPFRFHQMTRPPLTAITCPWI